MASQVENLDESVKGFIDGYKFHQRPPAWPVGCEIWSKKEA